MRNPDESILVACATALLFLAVSCQSQNPNEKPELTVAAAANLTDAFAEIGPLFTRRTGTRVIFSFGATADLAKQIENGAPFDVFAAADTAHVEQLDRAGLLTSGSRALYARGRLVVWLSPASKLKLAQIQDLTGKEFERIAIPKPDVAPYGRAAVESLQSLGIWNEIQPKVVYGQSVSQAKQFVATGNAEAAFIPLALVKPGEGVFFEVDEKLHQPIDQAMGIIKSSRNQPASRQFVDFLLSKEIQELLLSRGYKKMTVQ